MIPKMKIYLAKCNLFLYICHGKPIKTIVNSGFEASVESLFLK